MRVLLAITAMLLAASIHAGTPTEDCVGAPDNRYAQGSCPVSVASATLGTITTSGASVTNLPAGGRYFVSAGTCGELPTGRFHLVRTAAGQGFGADITGTSVTVDWLETGATNQCIALVDYSRGVPSDIWTSAPFSVASGGAQPINWNPLYYPTNKAANYHDAQGNFLTAAEYYSRPPQNILCQPDAVGIFDGEVFRLEVQEYEPTIGDRSAADAFLLDVHDYLSTGQCGGRPLSMGVRLDSQANKKDADQGLCSYQDFLPAQPAVGNKYTPADTNTNVYFWAQSGSGRTRCALTIWKPGPARDAYEDTWFHLAELFGDSPYVEIMSPKGEGAWINASNANSANFDPATAYAYIMDFSKRLRAAAPRVGFAMGTNNFMGASNHGRLLTDYKPTMDSDGGYFLRWPDTFAIPRPTNPKGVTSTPHGAYYHLFQGDHGMWGEFQFADTRFGSYDIAVRAAVDPNYNDVVPPNSEFRDASDNPMTVAPPNVVYGNTHIGLPLTQGPSGFPLQDLLDLINAPPYNGTPPLFDTSCPDAWVAAGLQCVDRDGNVIP